MTFRDIWLDYQNFRRSYYFYQLPTPKEVYEQNEEPVKTEDFKPTRWLLELFKNSSRHPYLSPQWLFVRVVSLIAFFYLWRVLRWPFERYYDWEDPLKPAKSSEGINDVMLGTEEEIRERLRYKRRVKNFD